MIKMAVGNKDCLEAFNGLKALRATRIVHATIMAVGDPNPRIQQDVDAVVGGN
jgi:hypothetical protein